MPEMPEVEVVRRGLAVHVVGRQVHAAHALHPRTVRRQPGGADEFAALLAGRQIIGTGRRGKFLWLVTDDPDLLLAAHLGMSGQFRVSGASPEGVPTDPAGRVGSGRSTPPDDHADPDPSASGSRVAPALRSDSAATHVGPHARAVLGLDDIDVWFVDQRTFGWLWAAPTVIDRNGVVVPLPVRDIAVDPTDRLFDARSVARAMRRHRVDVKRLLLAQTLVSGIGNIYADEALWRAGVHPRRRADRLSVSALTAVLTAATDVMAESLAVGGTSFDALYVDVNGRSGYFERGLSVYGRAGQPCLRCGTPIRREPFMNRSSHFCPRCQPAPRGRG